MQIRQGQTWLHGQSQAWEVKLFQHAMCQSITGLESNAIPACNAVKTLSIKEPAEAQKDEEVEGRLLWFLNLELVVYYWTSQPRATRDFSGSLAQDIGKPMNILILEQQQIKGLEPL